MESKESKFHIATSARRIVYVGSRADGERFDAYFDIVTDGDQWALRDHEGRVFDGDHLGDRDEIERMAVDWAEEEAAAGTDVGATLQSVLEAEEAGRQDDRDEDRE